MLILIIDVWRDFNTQAGAILTLNITLVEKSNDTYML